MFEISIVWLVFAGLLMWAALTDIAALRIPNLCVAALAGVFFIAVAVNGFPPGWAWHLAVFLGMLAFGVLLFVLRIAGAGDGKLLAVLGLWAGPSGVLMLVIATALAGIVVLIARFIAAHAWTQMQLVFPRTAGWGVPRGLEKTNNVPYGVAIAIGAVIASASFPAWLWRF